MMPLLLQMKLIIGGVLLVIFVGLVVALRIKSGQLTTEKANNQVLAEQLQTAVAQHDAMADELNRQRQILAKADAVRQEKEQENAKLYARLRRVLAEKAALWAAMPLPAEFAAELPPIVPSLPAGSADGHQPPGPNPDPPAGEQPHR